MTTARRSTGSCGSIVAYRFDGPLVFAAAHRFLLELSEVADTRVVILRMSRVSTLDATGARVLGEVITDLEHRGIVVLLSGIRPGHDQVLAALGVADHLRRDGLIFSDTPAAIMHARDLLTGVAEEGRGRGRPPSAGMMSRPDRERPGAPLSAAKGNPPRPPTAPLFCFPAGRTSRSRSSSSPS